MTDDLFDSRPYGLRPIDPLNAGDGWEYDRADKFYSGKSIHDVTLDAYKDYPGDWATSHYLLTDDAFLYFLPAFMKIAAEVRSKSLAEAEYASMLGGSIVTALSRMAAGEMLERKTAMLKVYSATQLESVARFFEDEVRWDGSEDFESVREALRFWRQFKRS